MNHLVTRSEELDHWLNKALLEDYVGFDIESASLSHTSQLAGFSLYLPEQDEAVYVAMHHPNHDLVITPTQTAKIASLKVKTYNGGFDLFRWNHNFNSKPTAVGDAAIASKMFQLHKFGLKNLAESLFPGYEVIRIEDVLGAGNFDFTKAPLNAKTRDYGCQDAVLSCKIEETLIEQNYTQEHHPGWDTVYALELSCMEILEAASCEGMPINKAEFEQAAAQMKTEADELAYEISTQLGRNPVTFSVNSPKRLAAALYNPTSGVRNLAAKTEAQREMTLPGLGLIPPNGEMSTAVDILELIEDTHPVIPLILRWKKLNAVVTRDLPQMSEFALKGMMHPQFVQIGEDGTSRIYTKQPNIIAMSMEARRSMPPRPGCIYAHIDFDAAEWRIAALLSGEVKILEALDSGIDPHKFTYSEMTGTPIENITHEEREVGKVLNYASLYGASPYRIGRALKVSQTKASTLLEDFWKAYPLLLKWIRYRKAYCGQHARTFTVLGRSRELKEVFTKDEGRRQAALRQSVNTAGQGSCGDALKLALRNLENARKSQTPNLIRDLGCVIRCPVFDAVLLEMQIPPEGMLPQMEAAILEQVEVTLTWEGRSTKMKAHVGWSTKSWADACGRGKSILDVPKDPLDPNKSRTFNIYAGDQELGKARGTSLAEACDNLTISDVSFAMGYDSDTLTFDGTPITEKVEV